MTKTLYLIGGSAGAGKSTSARLLARELDSGWLQLDTLWILAQEVAGVGSAAYGVLRIDERIRGDEPVERLVAAQVETSRLVCSWLPRALAFELQSHKALVADGAWLLPEFMAALDLPGAKVRGAIIHESQLAETAAAMASRREQPMVAPWDERSSRTAWEYGDLLAREARRLGIPVVAARPRETLVARLREALCT